MESVRLRLNQKLMLTPTCFMVDTMDLAITDLDMDTTDIPMLTTERGLLMLSQRLMPIPTSCTEDTMDLDTMVLDMDTTAPYAYYGKRSADAEPKADADPYLLY